MPKYTIQRPKKQMDVKGRPIKLRGYKNFSFFIHKAGKIGFHIREERTGLKVGWGNSEETAKKSAYAYLRRHIKNDKQKLEDQIYIKDWINGPKIS